MIKFEVLNRFSGMAQFTAEIDCAEDEVRGIKLGLECSHGIHFFITREEAEAY